MTSTSAPQTTAAPPGIGVPQGVALYVCAILGAGVLVLPGQAASLAGPAALVAWAFCALLGLPLAFTFARLASTYPDAGGVATYAARAFGAPLGGVTGWWFFIAGAIGHTIVPLTAGYYVADALGIGQEWAPGLAALVLGIAVWANLAGVKISARVQIGLALGVAVILVLVIAVALPQLRASELEPFAPRGVAGIGQAVVVLFFAFAGWEAIAHLSAEFRDVRRTLPRATLLTIVIITVLYLGVALAVIGTGTYGSRALDRISLGVIVEGGLGVSASLALAVAAVVICLGTTNAFMAAISRLGFALGRDGWAPTYLGKRGDSGVPRNAVLTVAAIGAAGLLGAALFGWGTETIVIVPSVLVLATYLLGMASGIKLFRGRARLLAATGFALLLLTVPFAGWSLLIPPAIAALALILRRLTRRRAAVPTTPGGGEH